MERRTLWEEEKLLKNYIRKVHKENARQFALADKKRLFAVNVSTIVQFPLIAVTIKLHIIIHVFEYFI